jgi:hypothetical protein
MYPGFKEAAILLLCPQDAEIYRAFQAVYDLNEAPLVDLEKGVPGELKESGTCLIQDHSASIAIGSGAGRAGVRYRPEWTNVATSWRRTAESRGAVWMALISDEAYRQNFFAGTGDPLSMSVFMPELPELPVLRLKVGGPQGRVASITPTVTSSGL